MLHPQLLGRPDTVFINFVKTLWKVWQQIIEVLNVMCMQLCPDAIAGEMKLRFDKIQNEC